MIAQAHFNAFGVCHLDYVRHGESFRQRQALQESPNQPPLHVLNAIGHNIFVTMTNLIDHCNKTKC